MTSSRRHRAGRPTRAETQAATRERLVEAALREVARLGTAASVRDIAAAAGFSQGALYANFASKEALLLELLRRHMQAEAEALACVLSSAQGNAEAALAGIGRWAATIDTDFDWSTLAIELQLHANRSASFAADYNRIYAHHRQTLGALVTQFFALIGRALPAAAVDLATGLMALTHGLAIARPTDDPGLPARTVTTFLQALLAMGMPAA